VKGIDSRSVSTIFFVKTLIRGVNIAQLRGLNKAAIIFSDIPALYEVPDYRRCLQFVLIKAFGMDGRKMIKMLGELLITN